MTEDNDKIRKPRAFSVEPPDRPAAAPEKARKPTAISDVVVMTPDEEDPFISEGVSDVSDETIARPKKGIPLFGIFLSALGLIFGIAFSLWLDNLIASLFARADWLGYTAIAITAIGALALVAMVARELIGLRRLASVQALKSEAELAAQDHRPAHARAVVAKLSRLSESIPGTSKGREALAATEHEIIDADGLLRLAELELLQPADRKARLLILSSSKRVSIVTAVSPRALVDLGFVIFESARLIRAIAETYGTRPGRLGMLGLFRDVIAHLAVTGSIAVGDGLAQQILGHGIASKLSARFGEGVINGLMTARIGISAMDLLRPLPFRAVRRPGVNDFLSDLTKGTNT
ncbi:YcjF family protein [Rhizobium alvei]|uniref:TIGR01620 family protein n=1 Tax=Rhizobium alvei TaxID=1132659 RepID=A0ABT8YJS1_9HYPH|nr:TIGR01620 family protein [Rhizobium alvei]MDO6963949.1 TIGR01620 family protein [Rhizobium alvei]